MDLKELKEKLTEVLLQEIEEITAEQLFNGEDEKGGRVLNKNR